MSLETSIAALTAQAGLLLDLPQEIQTQALAQIAAVTAAYNARIATLSADIYLDAAAGTDANSGLSTALPVKTITRAIAMVPPGGCGRIHLMSPLALVDDVTIDNKIIMLLSSSGTKHAVTSTPGLFNAGATTFRRTAAFRLWRRSRLLVNGLRFVIPEAVGAMAAASAHTYAAMITSPGTTEDDGHQVAFMASELDIPAAPIGSLTGFGPAPLSLYFVNVTKTGAGTLNGNLIHGVTNSAGTATSSLPNLLTNLATV